MRESARMILCLMIGALGACAQGDSGGQQPAPAGEQPAPGGQIELAVQIEWPPVDGAVEYRVQVWDGVRLLFEETRELPVLPVTDSMRRSLTGAATAGLQVRAIAADGRRIGDVHLRDLAPGGG